MQTLVLDQTYAPVEVIGWQRAIQLWFLGKCEILEEYDQELHSTFFVIKMPSVVRLLRRFRRQSKSVKFSRLNIYGRDDYTCQYCGKRRLFSGLTYDHVTPRAQGGKTTWSNIVTACAACNTQKGGRTPSQARMRLLRTPAQPKDTPAIVITRIPDAWRYWTGENPGVK